MEGSNRQDGRWLDCGGPLLPGIEAKTRGFDPLALARALTLKTERLCRGLPEGEADILELVTPVTAHLLRWWFGRDTRRPYSSRFNPGQRQAILNIVVAHEVLGVVDLRALYKIVAPEMLSCDALPPGIKRPPYRHLRYCINALHRDDRLQVLLALLNWQLLNKNAALAQGRDDLRFSHRFLLIARTAIERNRLLDIFRGVEVRGCRNFAMSALALHAELLLPPTCRQHSLDIWRAGAADADVIARYDRKGGFVAIAQSLACAELEFFARLPDLMVVNGVAEALAHDEAADRSSRENMERLAASRGRRLLRVDFYAAVADVASAEHPLDTIADLDLKTGLDIATAR
jgi:hypothetical protein